MLKRKFREPPEIEGMDREQNRFALHVIVYNYYSFQCRGLLEVFKLILEHTEYIGEQRIKLADSLVSQISEVCKTKKKDKETSFKKVCVIYMIYCTLGLEQRVKVSNLHIQPCTMPQWYVPLGVIIRILSFTSFSLTYLEQLEKLITAV